MHFSFSVKEQQFALLSHRVSQSMFPNRKVHEKPLCGATKVWMQDLYTLKKISKKKKGKKRKLLNNVHFLNN